MVAAGLFAWKTLPVDAFPDVTNVQVMILTDAPGLAPLDVEQQITAPIELAMQGHHAVMPAIVRTSNKPYRWKIGVAPLDKVANVEKMLPRDYITPDGFHITAKGRRYLAPLIQDWPALAQTPVYIVLGVIWLLPLRGFVLWMETGRWR